MDLYPARKKDEFSSQSRVCVVCVCVCPTHFAYCYCEKKKRLDLVCYVQVLIH